MNSWGEGAKKSDSEQFSCGHRVLGHFLFFKEGLLGNSVSRPKPVEIKDVTYCLPRHKSGPHFYCSVTETLSSSPLVITKKHLSHCCSEPQAQYQEAELRQAACLASQVSVAMRGPALGRPWVQSYSEAEENHDLNV